MKRMTLLDLVRHRWMLVTVMEEDRDGEWWAVMVTVALDAKSERMTLRREGG